MMKILVLVVSLMLLGACGPAFTSNNFTDSSYAGGSVIGAAPAGAPSAGSAPLLAGAGGSAGARESGAGSAGTLDPSSAGASGAPSAELPYTPPPCPSERNVTGGYDSSLNTAPTCMRTREALNTIACTNWDARTITVNGVPATCGTPLSFPESIDGYTYIDLGPGPANDAAVRWFLTAPAENACAARSWSQGDLYFPGEVMVGVCDFPGSSKSCELGKSYAFSCGQSAVHCSDIGPGASGWTSAWTLITLCK